MKKPKLANVPVTLTPDLHRDIRRASKATSLSQADVMRNAIRLGLPQFVKRFPKPESLMLAPTK